MRSEQPDAEDKDRDGGHDDEQQFAGLGGHGNETTEVRAIELSNGTTS
jgi:hypothetical protein